MNSPQPGGVGVADPYAVARDYLTRMTAGIPDQYIVGISIRDMVDGILDAADRTPLKLPRHRQDEEGAPFRIGGGHRGADETDFDLFAGLHTEPGAVRLTVSTDRDHTGHGPDDGSYDALAGTATAVDNARAFFLAGLAACDHAETRRAETPQPATPGWDLDEAPATVTAQDTP